MKIIIALNKKPFTRFVVHNYNFNINILPWINQFKNKIHRKQHFKVLNSEQTVVNFNLLRFCLDKERTEILFERLFEMVKKEKLDKEEIKKEFLLLGLASGLARGEKEENLKVKGTWCMLMFLLLSFQVW